jgi:hypothetical protein
MLAKKIPKPDLSEYPAYAGIYIDLVLSDGDPRRSKANERSAKKLLNDSRLFEGPPSRHS